MFQIDSYAYSNRLYSTHPGEKFAFTVATMIICLASSSMITALAVTLLMAGAVVLHAGIPWRQYLKLMTLPASFLLVGVATVAVSVSASGQPEVYLFWFRAGSFSIGVRDQDLVVAAGIFLKSLGATSCLYFLSLTTPLVEIISILRKLKAPPLFIELMSLVYRFIFVLAETAEKIYTSQSSRLGYRTLKNGYFSLSQLISSLFVRTLYRSKELSKTLSARCYTGEIRVLETRHDISRKNIVMIIVLELLLAALALYDGGGLVGRIHS